MRILRRKQKGERKKKKAEDEDDGGADEEDLKLKLRQIVPTNNWHYVKCEQELIRLGSKVLPILKALGAMVFGWIKHLMSLF